MKNKSINYSAIIKEARLSKGISQEVLAARVGVRKTTISNYEIGYTTPSEEIFEKIAYALDINLSKMIEIGAGDSFDLNLPRTFQGVNDVFIPYIRPNNISQKTLESLTYMDAYATLPGFMLSSDGNYLCIKVTDNSMSYAGICKNDYVFIRKSCNIAEKSIVLAINTQTDEYIIRRYHRDGRSINLLPSCKEDVFSIISYDENYPQYKIIGYVEKVLSNIK